MAGRVVVSTLNNDTGVLATQNGMTGIAKAWAVFSGSAGTISGSFNISSVTRNAAGQYTFSFTTSMPNTTYSMVMSVPGAGVTMWINSPLTGSCQVYSKNYANGFEDGTAAYQCIAFFSS